MLRPVSYAHLDVYKRQVRDLVTFTASTLPVWNGKLDILLDDLSPLVQKDSTVVVMGGTEKLRIISFRIANWKALPWLHLPFCRLPRFHKFQRKRSKRLCLHRL